MQIGIVKGREIKKNRDGRHSVNVLQVKLSDADDIQSVELMSQTGDESNPPDGSRVIVTQVGSAFKIALVSSDRIIPSVGVGEKMIYSTDEAGEEVKASILLKNDGTIIVNGGEDFAVRYSELESAFNQLLFDFNNHTHGTPAETATVTTASTADISGAKINEVNVP